MCRHYVTEGGSCQALFLMVYENTWLVMTRLLNLISSSRGLGLHVCQPSQTFQGGPSYKQLWWQVFKIELPLTVRTDIVEVLPAADQGYGSFAARAERSLDSGFQKAITQLLYQEMLVI